MNVFKGSIAAGALSARFASDAGNVDSDLLVMSYATNGGSGAQVDQATASPGGCPRQPFLRRALTRDRCRLSIVPFYDTECAVL